MAKKDIKIKQFDNLESTPRGVGVTIDNGNAGNISETDGITNPPSRVSGGETGSGTTPAGTVTLEINGTKYYLLYSTTA